MGTSAMKHDRFETIYRQEAEAVLRYLRYRVGPDTAEDLVAETFSVAWQKLAHVPDPPRPWLLATARRISANHIRARRRRTAHEVSDLDETLAVSDDGTDGVLRRFDLISALKVLPPLDREAILLVTWYDLSHVEAAAVMDCSTTAFAVRLHRARRRLGRILRNTDAKPNLTAHITEDIR
ncbi:RNA polymerase sigma factor [Nocardioides sp.]|uniref:RNA polymerase sigma factor n=1 Tax=Nocardioides sp. TaxID=35761 RepID=UPI002733CDFF|nr:RNA polymerase sigma factor [Nocardioides sp.]MDP3894478.1 RNA polymerase sigma factor [Nocardioides sp.]